MLKVGDIVTNTLPLRSNPVVCESRGWEPIPKGQMGVVVEVKQTNLNALWNKNGKGDVYVDVHVFDDGTGSPWKAGNYHSGSFSKII
tara:strand:- start:4950 stop:5210 length:261 start_codon:yes stop_codon:yes gene_type:complete